MPTASPQLTREEIKMLLEKYTPSERKGYIQEHSYNLWVKNNYRGTVEAATGVGKTRIGIMAVEAQFKKDSHSLVYIVVPTETLRDVDWPDEFKKWGMEHLLPKVKLICYSSLAKVRLKRDIDLMIFDEFHHMTIMKTGLFNPDASFKVWNILGLTATLPNPSRNAEAADKRALLDSLCPSIFKISLETAIELELVADFEIKVLTFDLDSVDKYIPGGTKAKPFFTTELAQYTYLTKCMQRMAMAKKDGAKWAFTGKRRQLIVNLKSKRVLAEKCIASMTKSGDKRTLVFCGGIAQSKLLMGDHCYNSETSDEYLRKFQAKEINTLAVVNALNEGKNINDLDQALVVQIDSNELNIIQRIGRTIRFRPGHKALIAILVVKNTCDEVWCENALAGFDDSRISYHHTHVRLTNSNPV